jgi:hypothetical protein
MWHLEEELIGWFERLQEERDEELDPDPDEERKPRKPRDKVVPLERNTAAAGRGRNS